MPLDSRHRQLAEHQSAAAYAEMNPSSLGTSHAEIADEPAAHDAFGNSSARGDLGFASRARNLSVSAGQRRPKIKRLT